jgi:hypothetical protein
MTSEQSGEGEEQRNPAVVAFLRSRLTAAEQAWPRFVPRLRDIHDVPLGELRTHPDLVMRIKELDDGAGGGHLQMLMGAPVLVGDVGMIYAVGFGLDFFAVRLTMPADESLRAVPGAANWAESPESVALLGPGWMAVNVWQRGVAKADRDSGLAAMQQLIERARDAAGSGGAR